MSDGDDRDPGGAVVSMDSEGVDEDYEGQAEDTGAGVGPLLLQRLLTFCLPSLFSMTRAPPLPQRFSHCLVPSQPEYTGAEIS